MEILEGTSPEMQCCTSGKAGRCETLITACSADVTGRNEQAPPHPVKTVFSPVTQTSSQSVGQVGKLGISCAVEGPYYQ